MNFYKISSYDELQSGAYGILEPITNEKYVPSQICNDISGNKTKDIIIIPGLVFDIKGNRIGYGGGYYDRYLLEHKNLIKCAVCYDFQIVDEGIIPYGKYDVKVDAIVTDKRLV
jgi:5-formyltetrahydrofolate cyclo-ligase